MRIRNNYSLLLIFNLILLSVISCVPSKPVYEEETITASRLIKKLEANRRGVKTFYGKGVMDIESKNFGGKASFEVFLKKPDSLMVSIYGPFGLDLAHALVNKNDFLFYDVMKNRVFKGKNREEALKEIFKVNLNFDDLMDAFAGAVNLTDKLRSEPTDYLILDEKYKLVYTENKNQKKSVYDIRKDDLAIVNYQIEFSSNRKLEGTYKRFKMFNDVPVPYQISLTNSSDNEQIKIEYRSISINSELEPLNIDIPKDAKVFEW